MKNVAAPRDPNNCPIIEQTADGHKVGACCFYIGGDGVCPRHGKVRYERD